MLLRVMTEPQQGATYDDLLRIARATEDLGYDAFFRSDHYLTIGGDGGVGSTDAWITLAGLARETSRIRLGTMVTPVTFRLPGPLAISVAGVDQMSGGRVELGLGTGWFDAEHTAYGIPFPPLGERFEMLEEQLQVIAGLWGTSPFSFSGKHYQLVDSPALPKPVQEHVPVVIGGFGAKRTPRLAATYADEYNVPFHTVEQTAEAFERVRAACAVTGRSVVLSAAQPESAFGASVDEAVDVLGRFREAGAERVYVQFTEGWQTTAIDRLEHLAAVLPQLS